MSHRQPRLKDQAASLRKHFALKGVTVTQGEALELVSRLNGYPSYNVAKQATANSVSQADDSRLEFKVWVGVHHHSHGRDHYYFTHQPSEDDVIRRVNEASDFEPDREEWVEVLGVETFQVDVPLELAKKARQALPSPLIGVYEINVPELIEYDKPEDVAEWRWVVELASFSHQGNGTEPGVWEFMVYADRLRERLEDIPEIFLPEVRRALELDAVWVMFHQG